MKYTRSFSGLGEAPFIKTANQLASSKMLHHGFRHLLNIPWMSRHSIRFSGSRDPFIAATVSSLGSWAYPLSSSLRSWTRDCRFFSERTRIRRYRFFRAFTFSLRATFIFRNFSRSPLFCCQKGLSPSGKGPFLKSTSTFLRLRRGFSLVEAERLVEVSTTEKSRLTTCSAIPSWHGGVPLG